LTFETKNKQLKIVVAVVIAVVYFLFLLLQIFDCHFFGNFYLYELQLCCNTGETPCSFEHYLVIIIFSERSLQGS